MTKSRGINLRWYKIGICSRCKKSKDLRKSSPRWCVECYTEYQAEYYKKYYPENKDKFATARARYKKTDKFMESHKNGKYRRRSRLENAGRIKAKEWRALCEKYSHKCLACGLIKPLTIDHIIPLSKGGANVIENVQPLCHSCNTSKGAKNIDYRPVY